jgi:hypothetical protein
MRHKIRFVQFTLYYLYSSFDYLGHRKQPICRRFLKISNEQVGEEIRMKTTKTKTCKSFLWIVSALFIVTTPVKFQAQTCVEPPSGMAAWWPGDGNSNEIFGSNPAVLQGGVVFASGMSGQAFSYNGVNGLAKAPYSSKLDIQSAITIEAWVNPTIPASTNIQAIAGRYAVYQLQINPDGKVLFSLSLDHTLDQQVISSNPLPANKFTHIAGTYDSNPGVQKLYINGVLDVTRQVTSGNKTITLQPTEEPFTFGGFAGIDGLGAFSFLQGLIDEVQVFSRALSDSEILSIYSSGSAGICKVGGGENGSGLFVPIVLSAAGLNNSFFTSEMALANRGTIAATVNYTYTAAFGGGSGTASDTLPAGQQRIVSDAISYLRSIGIPIPASGDHGGTLRVSFSGISLSEGTVTVRTATAVANGRAGLAYAGVPVSSTLTDSSYLCGLRQTATDRSNVAIQNVGTEGDIVLRVTVYSGDPAHPLSQDVLQTTLGPGGLTQISGILQSNGLSLSNGFVRVSKVSGSSPYFAYAVINDQSNSDGSFVPPLLESSILNHPGQTLPVIIETNSFSSELVATNLSASLTKTYHFSFVSSAIASADNTARFDITLKPMEQVILPNFVQYLRDHGIVGIGPPGNSTTGALFVTGDTTSLFLGARTSTPGGGGRFGLFYVAVPYGLASTTDAWIYGLQQNGQNRSNLGLVNTGETNGSPDTFNIELYNGETGVKVTTLGGITLNYRRWTQIGTILAGKGISQGYAHVIRSSGSNPFIAYGVINDGSQPGDRTGDGAYIPSAP